MRWLVLCRGAERFVRRPWAERALTLGWQTGDLFMCHRYRPMERLDCRGALGAICEAEVIDIACDSVTIRTATGAILHEQRPAPPAGEPVVMAWQLPTAAPMAADPEANAA